MSLFQEFQSHEKILGREKLKAIDFYVANIRSDLKYEEIIYNRRNFEDFEEWYYSVYLLDKCYNRNMDEICKAVVNFTHERDWDQFHSPENLAKSIAIESI